MHPSLKLLIPSIAFGTASLTLLLPILPTLKAHWYTTTCNTFLDPTCHADFHRASQYSGIFNSVRFLLIFAVSSFLGRLSDSYGRIPLMRLNNLAQMLYVGALVLTRGDSPAAYYSTWIISGLFTSSTFQIVAYIADIVPPSERLVAFGLVGAVSGLGLAVTPLLSAFSSVVTNNDIFLLSLLCLVLNQLYIEMVLPESLIQRKSFARQESLNPLTPFVATRESKTLQWLCLVTFLTALPESGVAEIALLYLDDVLGLQGEEAREFASLYLCLTGVGLLISQTLLLRLFLVLFGSNPVVILLISAVSNGLHMLVYSSVSLFPSKLYALFNIPITAVMFVGATAANSALSAHMETHEQGYALGVLDSVRSLVGAFGPILFSQVFSWAGDEWDMPQAPFYLGCILILLACLVIVGPLRWSIQSDKNVANLGYARISESDDATII